MICPPAGGLNLEFKNMIWFLIFTILGVLVGLAYFFKEPRFSFDKLLLSLWLIAIGVAQLRLSPYEEPWTTKFQFLLILFFIIFFVAKKYSDKSWNTFIKPQTQNLNINNIIFAVLVVLMTLASIIANIYIFNRFGTLPILSSMPDKMRFIINKEIFGLWEYIALLPRIFIPVSFIYLLINKGQKKWIKLLLIANIIFGFLILSLYASRVTIIFALLFCYFIYLIFKIKKINFEKIIIASAVILIIVLIISVSIPALRHYITYRDYYSDIDYSPFTYLADLSQLNIPESLNWVIPLYLIPSFNLQAMMRATDFYNWQDLYLGGHSLSVFPFFSEVDIPWKAMFLPWWVTATFLFSYWTDFGWIGIIFGAIFWGILLSGIYNWATKKPTFLSVMFFAYFSFVVIMSIYTNYFLREEFYLDIILILIIGLLLNYSKNLPAKSL